MDSTVRIADYFERLLEKLDATDAVRQDGRSAVLRCAIEAYLRQRQTRRSRRDTGRSYRGGKALGKEFAGWEAQAGWPDE